MRETSMGASGALSRRRLLQAAGLTAAVAPVLGCQDEAAPARRPVAVTGRTQAGVDRPVMPQDHLGLAVSALPESADVVGLMIELGAAVESLVGGQDPRLGGLDPGDLSVTVGVSPALVPTLPGGQELPAFAREDIPDDHRGGELMIQVCGSAPAVVALSAEAVDAVAGRFGAKQRWSQRGFQTAGPAGVGLNLLGFADGVVGPRTRSDLTRHVWLDDPPGLVGATVAVVRRIRLDVTRFLGQPVEEQEAVIGRRRAGGAPLSGGTVQTTADLGAKTPDGRYLVPASAHVRRANPHAAGVPPMLRRGYNYDNGPADQGLLFVSYQRSVRTFAALHARLDDDDALMEFTTTTASGVFVILPGYDRDQPLGSTIF